MRFRTVAGPVLTLLLTLLIAGCFTSDTPLLTEADAVTPLPGTFTMVETEGNGEIKLDQKGQAHRLAFALHGKTYEHDYDGARFAMTVAAIDHDAGVYLVQDVMESKVPDKGANVSMISYYIAKILDDAVIKYEPPSPGKSGIDAALKRAGIAYSENGSQFKFADRAQLLAAAKVYAARLVDGTIARYRVASTPDQIAALDREVAAAQARKAASSGSAPVAAAAPSAPQKPQEDPGAQVVDLCDELAAHPADPNRMAAGVKRDAIVPMRALQACEQAVAKFPNTARFRYQLGRAQEVSGNMRAALQSYQQAAAMGEGMGWANLGIASAYGSGGVAVDLRAAEEFYRRAIAAGIEPARQWLLEVSFPSDGYSNPRFFEAVFSNNLASVNPKSVSVYLGEFIQMFRNTPECQNVISTYAASKLLQNQAFGTIGQMFQALGNANRNYRPGDFGAAAQSGWDAGMNASNGLMLQVSNAQADAQLLYDRHGCQSPVARQFFGNLERLASRL